MVDIKDPRLIYAKGVLFFVCGVMAAALLIWEQPKLKIAALLIVAIWCFCRWYYFMFYVIEHYVDRNFRFAGLWSFARYVLTSERFRGSCTRQPKARSTSSENQVEL